MTIVSKSVVYASVFTLVPVRMIGATSRIGSLSYKCIYKSCLLVNNKPRPIFVGVFIY